MPSLRSSASASDSDVLRLPGILKDMKVFMEGQVNMSLHIFIFVFSLEEKQKE